MWLIRLLSHGRGRSRSAFKIAAWRRPPDEAVEMVAVLRLDKLHGEAVR
jgi:hypothetical protein